MKKTESSRLYSLDYTNMETSKWLERYDLPASAAARERWVAEQIQSIAKGVAVPTENVRKIFALAGHKYNLGEKEEAWKLVNELKDASKKAGGAQWGSFKEQVYSYFRHGLGIEEIGPDWQEGDYLQFLNKFYTSEDEEKEKLWKELTKAGDLTLRERFDLISDFYGWSDAPHTDRIASWKKMIELGRKNPDLLDLFLKIGRDFLPVEIVIEGILARDDRFEDLSETEQRFTLGQFVVLRDWKRALELFERMKDPAKKHPALAVGILRKAGRKEEANDALAHALNDCVILPSRLGKLSQELQIAGCYEEALALKKRMTLELSPDSSAWKQNLEWLWKEAIASGEQKQARAIALAICVSSVEGSSWGSYTQPLSNFLRMQTCRSLDLARAGKTDEAIEAIDKAIAPIPASTSIADIFIENIDRKAFPKVHQHVFQYAYQHYNKVIAKHPRFVRPRNGLAWLCAVSELHLEEAERHSVVSLTNNPDGSYYDTLARIHRGFGNFDEEFRIQKHAVQSSSSSYLGSVSEILAVYDDILRRRAAK
jgi:tetratricopeptide (TPR) repeat protein